MKRLIPIGATQESEDISDALSKFLARVAYAGKFMDIWCSPACVAIIAGLDRYMNEEITAKEFCEKLENYPLPTPKQRRKWQQNKGLK